MEFYDYLTLCIEAFRLIPASLFTSIIVAFVAFLGVYMTSRSNLNQLRLRLELESSKEEIGVKRKRLEEVYDLVQDSVNFSFILLGIYVSMAESRVNITEVKSRYYKRVKDLYSTLKSIQNVENAGEIKELDDLYKLKVIRDHEDFEKLAELVEKEEITSLDELKALGDFGEINYLNDIGELTIRELFNLLESIKIHESIQEELSVNTQLLNALETKSTKHLQKAPKIRKSLDKLVKLTRLYFPVLDKDTQDFFEKWDAALGAYGNISAATSREHRDALRLVKHALDLKISRLMDERTFNLAKK